MMIPMDDETAPATAPETEDYPLSMRIAALAGLFLVGALGFILLDIASGGRLTGGCTDCGDKPEASDDA